jgi:hypothetical protein
MRKLFIKRLRQLNSFQKINKFIEDKQKLLVKVSFTRTYDSAIG